MSTLEQLPAAVDSLAAIVSSLPAQLATAQLNLTALSSMLEELSSSLGSITPALGAQQAQALYSNTTFVSQNIEALGVLTGQIYPDDLKSMDHDSLVELIRFAATRYSITDVWTPDLWACFFVFIVAFAYKGSLRFLLRPAALANGRDTDFERARELVSRRGRIDNLTQKEVQEMTPNGAKVDEAMRKKAVSMTAHGWNLLIGSVCLILQLVGYRLFVLPDAPFTFLSAKMIFLGFKLILLSYAVEIAFADLHTYIYLHHFLSFSIPFVAEIAAYRTNTPKLFRLGQYCMLLATTEQTTYFSMLCFHGSGYLELEGQHPHLQKRLLRLAARWMRVTAWTCYIQKLVPIAFVFYWLSSMWDQVSAGGALGKFWLAWGTMLISALAVLQIVFCDQAWAVAAHLEAKVNNTPSPPRHGPLMLFLLSRFGGRRFKRDSLASSSRSSSSIEKGSPVKTPIYDQHGKPSTFAVKSDVADLETGSPFLDPSPSGVQTLQGTRRNSVASLKSLKEPSKENNENKVEEIEMTAQKTTAADVPEVTATAEEERIEDQKETATALTTAVDEAPVSTDATKTSAPATDVKDEQKEVETETKDDKSEPRSS